MAKDLRKLSNQVFVRNAPSGRDQLVNFNNVINLKRYINKIKGKIDQGDTTVASMPDYWVPKTVWGTTFYATFSNLTVKTSIPAYITLVLAGGAVEPVYLSKKVLVEKVTNSTSKNIRVVRTDNGNFINLKTYIRDLIP